MKIRILTLVLLVASCTNPTDGDQCDLSGDWSVTLETTEGDCMPAGVVLRSELERSELDQVDGETCTLILKQPYNSPETAEEFEVDGEVSINLVFDGDQVDGTAILTAELLEAGESVGSCKQSYRVDGGR